MRFLLIFCLVVSFACANKKSVPIGPFNQDEQITWQFINHYLGKMEEFHNGREVPACKEFLEALDRYALARKRSLQILEIGTVNLELVELKRDVLRTYREWLKVHKISHKSLLDLEDQLEKLPG